MHRVQGESVGIWISRTVGGNNSCDWTQDFHAYWLRAHSEGTKFYLLGIPDSKLARYSKNLDDGNCNWIHKRIESKIWDGEPLDRIYMVQSGSSHMDIPDHIDAMVRDAGTAVDHYGVPTPIMMVDTDNDSWYKSQRSKIYQKFRDAAWYTGLKNELVDLSSTYDADRHPDNWMTYLSSDLLVEPLPFNPNPEYFTVFVGSAGHRPKEFVEWLFKQAAKVGLPILTYGSGWKGYADLATELGCVLESRTGRFFDWSDGEYFSLLNMSYIGIDMTLESETSPNVRAQEYYYSGLPTLARPYEGFPNDRTQWSSDLDVTTIDRVALHCEYYDWCRCHLVDRADLG